MVRSVTVREPEWTPDVVALHLASRRLEGEIGSHGISLADATNPAYAGTWLVSDLPIEDHVKLALSKKQEAYYRQYPSAKDDRHAHTWYVKGRRE